ncbi:MAG: universal stress protein [Acidobacteria bacterium]|nr:universal stress protein [Acidobacteriota bacterium]
MRMQKILVPIDFSDRSTAAAEHAVALANHFHAGLIFAHVIPPVHAEFAAFEGALYTAGIDSADPENVAERNRQLDCFAKRIGAAAESETVVLKGDPAREIARFVEESPVDLIVMPTHGYGPFRRFVLGSVTAKVLHDVECPVFTGAHVPEPPAGDPEPYHRVAVAVDFGDHSETVLRWAAEFGAEYHAQMALIHAAPSLDISGRGGQYLGPEWRAMLLDSAKERAQRLLEKVGCRAEVYIDTADTHRYVPQAVAQFQANVLVVGRSPHGGLIGRLRTNAYALIRESPCPVVSV